MEHRWAGRITLKALLYLIVASIVPVECATLYPDFEYCSKHIEKNVIEPMPQSSEFTLKQIQIVMRHGARTLATKSSCWSGYNVTWKCSARMQTSPHHGSNTQRHHIYDNFYVEGETSLQGNCHIGQLLDEGFEQELENGRIFRAAYVGRNKLFDENELLNLSNQDEFYFSSTDMQRTVMSGQLVIDAMFPPSSTSDDTIPWHVGDIAQSSYIPNPSSCPKLAEVKAQFETSANYTKWLQDQYPTVNLTQTIFQNYDTNILFDCLLTSRCSYPDSLPSNLMPDQYDQIVRFERDKRMKIYIDDPTYAKLSMAKVLGSIRRRILNKVNGTGPRFAFYSGHDDTVMPVLAALGGGVWLDDWPPYAAYFVIELYANNINNHFLRFVYQGKALKLAGCSSDGMCPLDLFLQLTAYTTKGNICAASLKVAVQPSNESSDNDDDDPEIMVSFKALVLFVFIGVLLGVVFGLIIARTIAKNDQSLQKEEFRLKSPKSLVIHDGDEKSGHDEKDELLMCQSPKNN